VTSSTDRRIYTSTFVFALSIYLSPTQPLEMSLLDVGKACYQCSTVDFLPFLCPSCSHTFCRTHIHSHGCTISTTEVNAHAGPSSFTKKITCDYETCERPRIEAIAGVIEVGGVGKQVRCSGCQGAFCTMYVYSLSRIRK